MKNYTFFLILIIILNCGTLIQTDELLELSCFNETQCKIFQYFGLNSTCIEEQCHCTNGNGETVKCQASNQMVYNIISSPCPCKQPNSECDEDEDVCYCKNDYMPSRDKRRCIAKVVALGGGCELDSQCQRSDMNAICDKSKMCVCLEQFLSSEGKCSSIADKKSFCSNDSQCLEKYGANAKCSNITQYCICLPEYVVSIDSKRCLKKSKYQEDCIEDIQCMATVGAGGRCMEKLCNCSENHLVVKKKSKEDAMETMCTSILKLGSYCRFHEDCYQPQLNGTEQSMECFYGECNCRHGFVSYNDRDCVKGSGVGIKSLMGLNFLLGLFVFVSKYF